MLMQVDGDRVSYESGATRSSDTEGLRYDLISPHGLKRLAMTCAEGAAKYGDHNWQKGMPGWDLLNRTIRHTYLYISGDRSEDHLAHAAWNLFAFMHFQETAPHLTDITPQDAANEQRACVAQRSGAGDDEPNPEAGGGAFDALGRRI